MQRLCAPCMWKQKPKSVNAQTSRCAVTCLLLSPVSLAPCAVHTLTPQSPSAHHHHVALEATYILLYLTRTFWIYLLNSIMHCSRIQQTTFLKITTLSLKEFFKSFRFVKNQYGLYSIFSSPENVTCCANINFQACLTVWLEENFSSKKVNVNLLISYYR